MKAPAIRNAGWPAILRWAYNALLSAGVLTTWPWWVIQAARLSKRRRTLPGRLGMGRHAAARYDGKPGALWVHALSLGEVLSALPLVSALKRRFPERPIVFSASTASGFDTARKALSRTADAVVYFPYDFLPVVKKALSRVRPAAFILVETDIWPNFLWEARGMAIPVFLVNARLSDTSFSRYRKVVGLIKPIFSTFTRILTQSVADAGRFRQLGVPRHAITVTGNLKYDQQRPPDALAPAVLDWAARTRQSGKRIWVAGSTHAGEESVIAGALKRLNQQGTAFSLILAPRDPARSEAVCHIFEEKGCSAVRLSALPAQGQRAPAEVLVIDAIGLLRSLYGLADITFVGGSLVAFGGHNPLEPAALGKPILYGPHMTSFREISTRLLRRGAAITVSGAADMAAAVGRLAAHPEQAASMGKRALAVFSANQGAVEKTIAAIKGALP